MSPESLGHCSRSIRRAETEVADFPSIGKIGVFSGGHSHFYDEEPTIKLAPKDWIGAK